MLPYLLACLLGVGLRSANTLSNMPSRTPRTVVALAVLGNNLPQKSPLQVIAAYAHLADWATDGRLVIQIRDKRLTKDFRDAYEQQSRLLNKWRELRKPHLRLGPVENLKNMPQPVDPSKETD